MRRSYSHENGGENNEVLEFIGDKVLDFIVEEDDEDNYVALIQEWCSKETGNIPLYHFEEGSYQATWYMPFDGISQNCNVLGSPEYNKLIHNTRAESNSFRGVMITTDCKYRIL